MYLSVSAQKIPRIDRPLPAHISRSPARFLHNNPQWRKVPRLRCPIQRRFRSTFRHKHVLPESSKRPPAASGIGEPPDLFLSQFVLNRPRARGEHHRLAQPRDVRDVNALSIAIRALAAIRPPAAPEPWRARHAGYDLSIALDAQQRPKSRNAPRKFLRAVNRINDQSRPFRYARILF